MIREIATIQNIGKRSEIPVERLGKLYFNERPVCLVDDFHLCGLDGESYYQLKLREFLYATIADEFQRQTDLDKAHGFAVTLHFVVGLPRNMKAVRSHLNKIGLNKVVLSGYSFGENAWDAMDLNPSLVSSTAELIGSYDRLKIECAFDQLRIKLLDSRGVVPLITLLHDLHDGYPHLFYPLEKPNQYDRILEPLAEAAPDVFASIQGPSLVLQQGGDTETFTIPWGFDNLVNELLDRLADFNKSEADESLNIADVTSILMQCDWTRAVGRRRTVLASARSIVR